MKTKNPWRNLSWLQSQAMEVWLRLWNSVSPQPFAKLYRIIRPFTMSGCARLHGLHRAVEHAVARHIPGDFVECGTARGGSAALMGLASKQFGGRRTLWVFDTFEGLPPPTRDDPDWEIAARYTGQCRGDLNDVTAFFDRVGILSDSKLVKGMFQDTLAGCGVKNIAVLHVDGDWYESVKVCLDTLYDRVSPGGIIQIDDYGHWEGARKAVDEFLARRGLSIEMRHLDYTGRQWIKS